MKGLIEKYAVLKNLRPEYLAQDFDLGKSGTQRQLSTLIEREK